MDIKYWRWTNVQKSSRCKITHHWRSEHVVSPFLSDSWSKLSHDYTEYMKSTPQGAQGCMAITHTLCVYKDITWRIFIHCIDAKKSICVPLKYLKGELDVQERYFTLWHLSMCLSHPDQHFVEFVNYKNGKIVSKDNSTVAFLDTSASVIMNGEMYSQTVRPSSYELLTHGTKCSSCTAYCDTLRVLYNRWKKKGRLYTLKQSNPRSRTPFSNFSTRESKDSFK